MSANRRRRARAGRVVVTVAVVAAVGAAAAAGLGLPDRSSDAGTGASTAAPKTTKVTRQTLVDTQTEDGKLGHGDSITVTGRIAGTLTGITGTGSTVQRGQSLFRVDNTPVVLLYGSLPAYRALAVGTKGADVKQFEENLAALGYKGFTVDETYSESTATAVREWQGKLGLTKTGVVDLGRVYYAAGSVRIESLKANLGDALGPGAAVLTCTGTAPVITVELDVADQRLAKTGSPVTLTAPDGKSVAGKITEAELVIKPAENNKPAETKVKVTAVPDDGQAFAGLDQVTVEVGFTADRKENVLTVPVAALLALAEGGYGVQVVDGATSRVVAVKLGMFAAGRVEISGDGIAEGTTVGVPS